VLVPPKHMLYIHQLLYSFQKYNWYTPPCPTSLCKSSSSSSAWLWRSVCWKYGSFKLGY